MKKLVPSLLSLCLATSLILPGCAKRTGSLWEGTKTTKHKQKNSRSFWKHDSEEDFSQEQEELLEPTDEDFIPLREEDLQSQAADGAVPQPKDTPGAPGSGLPGIEGFHKPTAHLASIFRSVHFQTDDHILRGQENLSIIDKIAEYLKGHPHTYVFIEGHCDERGPEAYNLSLGARRANYVRTLLVKKGADLNQLHTISYGKERPIDLGHNPESWSKNRRAEFKLYEKP